MELLQTIYFIIEFVIIIGLNGLNMKWTYDLLSKQFRGKQSDKDHNL
jgi:hypothetical protein